MFSLDLGLVQLCRGCGWRLVLSGRAVLGPGTWGCPRVTPAACPSQGALHNCAFHFPFCR